MPPGIGLDSIIAVGSIAVLVSIIAWSKFVSEYADPNDDAVLGLNIPFLLSWVAIVAVVIEFVLPGMITSRIPFAPAVERLDTIKLVLGIGAVIVGWWVVEARFLDGKTSSKQIGRRLQSEIEDLVRAHFTLFRFLAAAGFGIGFLFAGELGQLAGELGGHLTGSIAPLVGSNLFAAALGFLGLGGTLELPVVGRIPPMELNPESFALVALGTATVAIILHYT